MRVFDVPTRATVRATGGMCRYIPRLHIVTGARVYRSDPLDDYAIHEFRRHVDGSFTVKLEVVTFNEESPFLSRLPRQRFALHVTPEGITPLPT